MATYTESIVDLHSANRLLGWQTAIEDAESEIEKCKDRIARLRAAQRTFRLRLKQGEPFPGTQSKSAVRVERAK